MTNTLAIRLAALMGFLAVTLGAFGAHGLKDLLAQNHTTAIWDKAVFYHFIHTVMLFLLAQRRPMPSGPWLSLFVGILIFSGSLPARGDECEMAGRDYAGWRAEFAGGVGVALSAGTETDGVAKPCGGGRYVYS